MTVGFFVVVVCLFVFSTKYLHIHPLKAPSTRPATEFTSTKVTSNVLTHIAYVSLMMITSFQSTSSFMSLTYKWFAVMWLPEIDCYRHWNSFWYHRATHVAFSTFNSRSKVNFPFRYQKSFPGSFCNFAISVLKTLGQIYNSYSFKNLLC